jgi:hypothetical protein
LPLWVQNLPLRGVGSLRPAGLSIRLVEEDGLGSPITAFNVAGYELDVFWPDLRFAVELEEDRQRDEDLKLAGIELPRVTGRRFRAGTAAGDGSRPPASGPAPEPARNLVS